MGLFRPDRAPVEGDAALLWKVRLFVIGAGLGFVGMMTEIAAVLWVGIAFLTIGVAMRFSQPSPDQVGDQEPSDEPEAAD